MTSERGQRLGYRPALDGARAAAILPVIGFHSIGRPTGGFLGVDIFFVLSGFLITTLLLEEWDARGTISLAHFYLRRALRLLPALVFAIVGFGVLSTIAIATERAPLGLTAGAALRGALLGLLYVSNIAQAAGTDVPASIGHLWSLATEEQFYLLWPPCLLLALWLGASRRAIGLGLAAAIAVLAAHRLELTLRDVPQPRIYFGPDGAFDLILVGSLAGLCLASADDRRRETTRRVCRLLWLPVSVAAVSAILVAEISDRALYQGLFLAFGIAIGLLILSVVLDERSLLARMLSFRPFVYVGKISYALYLWHMILLATGLMPSAYYPRAAVGVALSFVAASASYHLVEQRFLRLKHRDRAAIERSGRQPEAPPGIPAPEHR